MEIVDDFYLVLPSNSSLLYFPDNVTSCYSTYLPREIRLNGGGWSVGLVDVHIPNIVEHIEDNETWYRIDGHENEHFEIKSGIYDNLNDLVHSINETPEMKGHQKISASSSRSEYYSLKRFCDCKLAQTLLFHEKIHRILGFPDQIALVTNAEFATVEAEKPA